MAQNDPSNPLLSFMSEATTNLQQALSRPGKRKKVNHRRYLTKRLKQEGKAAVKPRPPQKSAVATAPANQLPALTSSLPSWEPAFVPDLPPFTPFYPPQTETSATPYPSPPPAQEFDRELEELLTEIGLESPSQSTQYACVDSPASLTRGAVIASQTAPTGSMSYNTYLSSDLLDNHLSPPSDFSDIDDSYPSYPSSRSDSPAYQSPPNNLSLGYSNHQVYGSCEWLPVPAAPSQPTAPMTPSLNELLGYYPLPEHC